MGLGLFGGRGVGREMRVDMLVEGREWVGFVAQFVDRGFCWRDAEGACWTQSCIDFFWLSSSLYRQASLALWV
jgi:hypothetical protein